MALPFFGLTPEHMEKVAYEELFYLVYTGGFSLEEAYNIPVFLRSWFLLRLVEEKKKETEAMK